MNNVQATSPTARSLAGLDLCRFCAAAEVLAGHTRAFLLVPWSSVDHPSVVATIIYFVTGFGHQAVMVFFVLSGYLISKSVVNEIRGGVWSWESYLVRRASRLYVVLAPALLMGLLWDGVGSHLFAWTGVYNGLAEDTAILTASAQNLTAKSFIGNLFFLQKILVPPFGSNSPLWSLAYEGWYYLAFPLLALSLMSYKSARKALGFVALVAVLSFAGKTIATYFMIWLLGTAVAIAPPRRVGAAGLLGALFIMMGVLVLVRFGLLTTESSDGYTAVAFAMILWATVNRSGRDQLSVNRLWERRLWARLSGFSYTLYLVHFPILVFIHAMLFASGIGRWQPNVSGLSRVTVIGVGVVVYAWLVSLVTERHTDEFRSLLIMCLRRLRVVASLGVAIPSEAK
jgi:peptidoglycan/LPS O-acetylase OafA/YrhL